MLCDAEQRAQPPSLTLLTRVVAAPTLAGARDKATQRGAPANLIGDGATLSAALEAYREAGVDTVFCMFDDEQSFDCFVADVLPEAQDATLTAGDGETNHPR